MLEANGFDFRSRHPQNRLVKLAKGYGVQKDSEVASISYRISIDLYRTFAPIKQTTTTMVFACLELAGRLVDNHIEDVESGKDYEKWKTSREEVMGECFIYTSLFLSSTCRGDSQNYQRLFSTYLNSTPTTVALPLWALASPLTSSSLSASL